MELSTARKEVNMLFHLPIAILATLSPIAISDTVPKFDMVKECALEGGPSADVARCFRDEAIALRHLQEVWAQYAGADRTTCTDEAIIGGLASYVELLTCLEMTSYVNNANGNFSQRPGKFGVQPMRQKPHGVTVGIGDGPISSKNER
jgi:hypothetical protein